MIDPRDADMIPLADAGQLLVQQFRRRLEENPALVLFHWQKRIDRLARLDFYDDDWVLLAPRRPADQSCVSRNPSRNR